MGVNTTPPLPKSQPDVSKLNSFSGYVVTVTRQLGPRGSGQMVVPTQRMTKDKVLDLQVSLPLQHGPGYYLFSVADEGGTAEDVWLTKLGPDIPLPQEYSMAGSNGSFPTPPGPPPPSAPLDGGVVQIMPGYYYNDSLGLLQTPWRKTVSWRQGDPLPEPPAHTPMSAAAATPWNPQQPPGWGWGGYPVEDDKTKRLEAEISELRRREEQIEQRRREDQARDEQRRREEERERREEQRAAETREMFKSLATALTAKPAGPSEHEQRLERELLEEKRRREEQARDEARRREEQAREDARRAELKAMEDRHTAILKELERDRRDRPDPMLTMMSTIFQSQQQAAVETARLSREAADRMASASERHTQQLVETMRADKTGVAESQRMMMESTREVMGLYREGAQFMIENSSNGAPWYASAIQGALDKIGPGIQAIAQARQQQAQATYAPPAVRQPPAARTVTAPATTRPIPSVSVPTPQAIGVNSTGDRPDGVLVDGNDFIVPGGPGHPGYRVSVAYVGQHGWAKTLADLARQAAPSPVMTGTETPEANMNGAAPTNGAASPPTLSVVPPPADVLPPAKKGRGKKAKQEPAAPPPANPQRGYTGEELQAMTPEEALASVAPIPDEMLFGDLWPYVQQLRQGQPTPEQTVDYIVQAQSAGMTAPVMELLRAGQLYALIERLLPGTSEEYQEAVVDTLAARLGIERIEEGAQA